MYSSNSSLNGNNLISSSYPNQTFCSRPFSLESNPSNYSNEYSCQPLIPPPPPNLSFFQFPYSNSDPFEDHNQINFLDDFLPHHHHHNSHLAEPVAATGQDTATLMEQTQKKANIIIPRKRSSKRDRHSKINTAKGLRDRRMRLSLEVAKRFFGLQDMLGFDKASKTVDWLLNQAKVEIKHLAREKKVNNIRASCTTRSSTAKSASSTTSECEGVSGLDEVNEEEGRKEVAVAVAEEVVKMRRSSSSSKVCRKSAFNAVGREKARERARERTREKLLMRTRKYSLPDHVDDDESNSNSKQQCNNNEGTSTLTNHNNGSNSLINMLSWNPFETTMEEESAAGTRSVNPFEAEEQPSSHSHHADLKEQYSGTVQDMAHEENNSLLINMSKWSPMFSPLNNSGILQQPHQFGDQFHQSQLGKHWEAYNNRIQS